MRLYLILAGILVSVAGAGVVLYLMFTGPRMRVQAHVRAFDQAMPLPPPDIVPVAAASPLPALPIGNEENPLTGTADEIARGKVYYAYFCAFCHGARGDGQGDVGPSFSPPAADLRTDRVRAMTDGQLLRAMLTGKGHEPVLARSVHERYRWYIVMYVRGLALPAAARP